MYATRRKKKKQVEQHALAAYLVRTPELTILQKAAVFFGLIACGLSTSVCAWMGGSGAQSVFQSEDEYLYTLFFILSPILFLMLSGRAVARLAIEMTRSQDVSDALFLKPAPSLPRRLLSLGRKVFAGFFSSAINAYNTLYYVPYPLNYGAFVFALAVPGVVNVPAIRYFQHRISIFVNYPFQRRQAVSLFEQYSVTRRDPHQILLRAIQYARLRFEAATLEAQQSIHARLQQPFDTAHDRLVYLLFWDDAPLTQKTGAPSRYAAGLGLIIGVLSQWFSYVLGCEIGEAFAFSETSKPVIARVFGVLIAYYGMGMNATATSEVLSELSAVLFRRSFFRALCAHKQTSMVVLLLGGLAITASSPNAENQIQVMGREGWFSKLLTACAIVSPVCVGFWGGNLVRADHAHRQQGGTWHYLARLEALERSLRSLKPHYIDALYHGLFPMCPDGVLHPQPSVRLSTHF